MTRNLSRRLDRLITREIPRAPRVLQILVTRIGQPDETIELVLDKPNELRRGFWQDNRERNK